MIRIGIRDNKWAFHQAKLLQKQLSALGQNSDLLRIHLPGEFDGDIPSGAFSHAVNRRLLSGEIDLAIFSHNDLPLQTNPHIELSAVLERSESFDALVKKPSFTEKVEKGQPLNIVSDHALRTFQWRDKYPQSKILTLTGNIPSLHDNNWDGALFAQADLALLDAEPDNTLPLHEFVPPACQGSIALFSRAQDKALHYYLNQVNHPESYIRTHIEYEIIRKLEVDHALPFGCTAKFQNPCSISLEAQLFNYNGSKFLHAKVNGLPIYRDELIASLISQLKNQGAATFLKELKEVNAQLITQES